MNICVIPARGGSKRIQKKNIKFFLGKPIIAYSIETALNSKLFDKVIVSTDDENIANVAKKYGAEVPFIRPKKLSDDFTCTNSVVKHAINWFLEQDLEINYVCCIYATAPFLNMTYLNQGLEMLRDRSKLFAFSVTSFSFPIQRAIKISNDKISMFNPEYILKRSQDLDKAYHDAGQFYWGKAQAFLDELDMFSENSIPIFLPRYMVQDIDTLEDWKKAEFMYKVLKMEKKHETK
jgi:pseudaminic acid cytidylyltransferase